jgi:hypothetical protein
MKRNSRSSPLQGIYPWESARLTRVTIILAAAAGLLISPALAVDQRADLLAQLKDKSIPVEAIEVKGDVVTARLVYSPGAERTSAQTEEDMLFLFSRIAESYPESKRIVLDMYAGAERISEIEVEAESALGYAQGKNDARKLLGSARMAAHLDIEKIMEEAIAPRTPGEEPPMEALPEKIIPGSERTVSRAEDSGRISGGGGGGAEAKRSPAVPLPLLVLLALLLGSIGLVIALILRRRETAGKPQAVSARIEILYPDGGRKSFEIREARTAIGRAKDNHLVLHDSGVSSHHAEITISGGAFILKDRASANGIFLNGEKIQEAPLYQGDEILLGTTKLTIGS